MGIWYSHGSTFATKTAFGCITYYNFIVLYIAINHHLDADLLLASLTLQLS
jgi:hypothetical protein